MIRLVRRVNWMAVVTFIMGVFLLTLSGVTAIKVELGLKPAYQAKLLYGICVPFGIAHLLMCYMYIKKGFR